MKAPSESLSQPPRCDQGSVSATYIALWVRKVVLNELDGWFHFKRPVRSICVVPEEVSHRPPVCLQEGELFRVKECILVIVNILLLKGAVKAFGMGVHP